MKLELIQDYKFVFTADNERGFRKLKNNQQANFYLAFVTEHISNALDACKDKEKHPIKIYLKREKTTIFFIIQDSGAIFTEENLNALHKLGFSSKRGEKSKYIGRFGIGFVTVFNNSLYTDKVEIFTNIHLNNGDILPYKILFKNQKDKIPLWSFHKLSNIQKYTKVIVTMKLYNNYKAKIHFNELEKAILYFLKRTTFPIFYNDKLYKRDLDKISYSGKYIYSCKEENGTKVRIIAPLDHYGIKPYDKMEIIVRGITIEKDRSTQILSYSYGEKHPYNYYSGHCFLRDEEIIVESNKLEVTVSRNNVIRDDEFYRMQGIIEKLRVKLLLRLFKGKNLADKNYIEDHIFANLYLLRHEIRRYLKNESYNEIFKPLIEFLIKQKVFPIWDSRYESYSILDIMEKRNKSRNIIFYANTEEDSELFCGAYEHDFILRPYTHYSWARLYKFNLVENILQYILNDIEFINLGSILERRNLLHKLLDKRIFDPDRLIGKYSIITPSSKISKFLRKLEELLKQPLIKNAFKHVWIDEIKLLPIEFEKDKERNPIAFFLEANNKEIAIGINTNSNTLHILSELDDVESAVYSFLPLLCHQLVYYWWTLKKFDLYVNYIGFEDYLLDKAIKVLKGEDKVSDLWENLSFIQKKIDRVEI